MLTIIRGVPGSGKSHLALALVIEYTNRYGKHPFWVEADDYMVDEHGFYRFDPSKLTDCHEKCQAAAYEALQEGIDTIVSNTFTQRWEYQPYLDMAKELDVLVQVIEVHGQFQNVHGVPAEKLKAMRERWEPHKE